MDNEFENDIDFHFDFATFAPLNGPLSSLYWIDHLPDSYRDTDQEN
jgi:hypothetical protein